MKNLTGDIGSISDKKIPDGDLNLVFDWNLEACSGNPVLKKKSLTKFIEIKKSLNLCDILRINSGGILSIKIICLVSFKEDWTIFSCQKFNMNE